MSLASPPAGTWITGPNSPPGGRMRTNTTLLVSATPASCSVHASAPVPSSPRSAETLLTARPPVGATESSARAPDASTARARAVRRFGEEQHLCDSPVQWTRGHYPHRHHERAPIVGGTLP